MHTDSAYCLACDVPFWFDLQLHHAKPLSRVWSSPKSYRALDSRQGLTAAGAPRTRSWARWVHCYVGPGLEVEIYRKDSALAENRAWLGLWLPRFREEGKIRILWTDADVDDDGDDNDDDHDDDDDDDDDDADDADDGGDADADDGDNDDDYHDEDDGHDHDDEDDHEHVMLDETASKDKSYDQYRCLWRR